MPAGETSYGRIVPPLARTVQVTLQCRFLTLRFDPHSQRSNLVRPVASKEEPGALPHNGVWQPINPPIWNLLFHSLETGNNCSCIAFKEPDVAPSSLRESKN